MTENNAAQPGLTSEQILSLERRGSMTDDEALRYGRAIESALLSKLRAEGVQAGDERAAFEAWATAIAEKYDVTRNGDHYMEPYTEWVWEAWQARAALASAPVAGEAVGEIVLFGGELKEVSWREGKMPPQGTKLYAAPQASEAVRDALADLITECDRADGQAQREVRRSFIHPHVVSLARAALTAPKHDTDRKEQ